MNCKNEIELKQNDITTNTKISLNKKECNDTIWKRNCPNPKNNPTCVGECIYKYKRSFDAAIKKNRLCRLCKNLKHDFSGLEWKIVNEKKKWIRKCPNPNNNLDCLIESLHSNQRSVIRSIIGNRLCNSCKFKGENHVNYGKPCSAEHKQKISNNHADQSGKNHPFYGKHHTKKSNDKNRQSQIKRIMEFGITCYPGYNTIACKVLDDINEFLGWKFQHALNGGEIKVLKYSLDGYEKERNIAFEYDERRHFNKDGTLKKCDIIRQKEIEEHLGCKFIRMKYTDQWKDVLKNYFI
jgi:hypothetical protein